MRESLWLSVAVVSGAAAGAVFGPVPATCLASAIATMSVAAVVPRGRPVVGLAVGLAACAYGTWAADAVLGNPLRRWATGYLVEGRATDVALVSGTLAADAAVVDGTVRIAVDTQRVDGLSMRGRLHAYVGGELAADRVDEWTAGRRVVVPVLLRDLPYVRNPGSPSVRWQRLTQRADLIGTVKSAALVEVAPASWPREASARMRARVRDAIRRHVTPMTAQGGAVTTAILIGDRAGLDRDVRDRLRAAGTYHVVAISGGNVAILAALVYITLGAVLRSFRLVAIVTLVLIVGYGVVVGGEPSVRRAVTAASMYFALTATGVRPRALHVLAVTALGLAVVDPLTTVDPGAWLSFGATLGILIGASRFVIWATAVAPEPGAGRAGGDRDGVIRRAWLAVLTLLGATIAAELTLLPLAAGLFSRAGLLGLVLNFVAIPAMTIVQLAGIGVCAFAGWADPAAAASGRAAAAAATWLIESSNAADAAPWLVWRVPPPGAVWSASFYLSLLAAVGLRPRTPPRRVAIGAGAISALAIVTAPGLGLAAPSAGRLRVTLLDVGQGDAIAVQFPSGQSLLIDAGGLPASSFDTGERVVTPALWALGIRRLDWMAVSHGDVDHVGGMSAVARDFRPREIWEGVPVPSSPPLQALRTHAQRAGVGWRQIVAGHRLEVGGVVVEALHPPVPDWERRRVRNDDSLVLRVRFGRVELLLTGDAGQEFEDAYAGAGPGARLRVLKIGHHGSRTSSSARFLEAAAPHLALVSVGRSNTFGHPTREVLARLQTLDAIVLRTDLDGAITIETGGERVEATTWSGRRWTLDSN